MKKSIFHSWIPEDLLEKENALVARFSVLERKRVDPDELRDEDEEAGFQERSILG